MKLILDPSAPAAEKYQLTHVGPDQANRFAELTFPHFRHLLASKNSTPFSTVVLGLETETEALGLALASYESDPSFPAQLLSLFVVPTHRNRGLGRILLSSMESELQQRGCSQVELRYLESPHSPALVHLLSRHNWSPPRATALVCRASVTNVRQTSHAHLTQYIDRLLSRLPQEYSIFPWSALSFLDRQRIERQIETDPRVHRFNPFLEKNKLEPLNSLGLRCGKQVVGWVITHRIGPDMIRYTQMFVHPDSQPLSRSTLLLAKAIQLQVNSGAAEYGTFRVDMDNTPMVAFVHRRLTPYLDSIRYAFEASKSLA